MTKELENAFNMNERELSEYCQSIVRVLSENFLKDVFAGKITMVDAIKESVELWDKKMKDMSIQLLGSHIEGNGVTRKTNQMADILLDVIHAKLAA